MYWSWGYLQALPDVEECRNGKRDGEEDGNAFGGNVDVQTPESCDYVNKLLSFHFPHFICFN
jgi:hypothetical protein